MQTIYAGEKKDILFNVQVLIQRSISTQSNAAGFSASYW